LRAVPASQIFFVALFGLVAVERLGELVLSRRNARRLRARGGVDAEGAGFYALMVAVHALFLVAPPLEALLLGRPFRPWLGGPTLALAVAAQALRYWTIAALGGRWSTRVVVVPGDPPATAGPYRFVRHPNYLAVILEMFALPLIHGAWLSALLFSVANAVLLGRRIAHEEAALERLDGYREQLGGRRRLVPGRP